jgi:predicted DNA-binding transcriptional regulator AlpA
MTKRQVAQRLQQVRRELDECAEWVDRLAAEVDEPDIEMTLVGLQEAAAMSGLPYKTFQQRYNRGNAPTPLALLACGPVWDAAEIKGWARKAVAA